MDPTYDAPGANTVPVSGPTGVGPSPAQPLPPATSEIPPVPGPVPTPILTTPEPPSVISPSTPPVITSEPVLMSPESSDPEENKPRKKVVLFVALGLIILTTVIGGIFLASKLGPKLTETKEETVAEVTPTPILNSATVSFLEGSAWSSSGGVKSALAQNEKVFEGSTLETGEETKMAITLPGGLLRVGPNTKVTLTSLKPEETVVTEETGALYAFVDGAKTQKFSITAGTISVLAEGTAFSVEKDELTAVNVYHGKLVVVEGDIETPLEESGRLVQGLSDTFTISKSLLESDDFLGWAIEEEVKRVGAEISAALSETPESLSLEDYKTALESLDITTSETLKADYLKSTTGKITTITLTGQKSPDSTAKLVWSANGLAGEGYKVIWSKTPAKAYPGDKKTGAVMGYEKTLGPFIPEITWYLRVCEWTGTGCGIYSNELSFTF